MSERVCICEHTYIEHEWATPGSGRYCLVPGCECMTFTGRATPERPVEREGERWQQYRRTAIAEMADWHVAFDMSGVSVSAADRQAGSPKRGDKIARNPANHADRWLVAADYFAANFEALRPASTEGTGEREERIAAAWRNGYYARVSDEKDGRAHNVTVNTIRRDAEFYARTLGTTPAPEPSGRDETIQRARDLLANESAREALRNAPEFAEPSGEREPDERTRPEIDRVEFWDGGVLRDVWVRGVLDRTPAER